LKLIADLMNEAGISGMRFSISETAKWGDVSVGPKIIDASVKKRRRPRSKTPVRQIRQRLGGRIQRRLQKIQRADEKGANHPIEKVGERLRSLMPWMKKRSIKGGKPRIDSKFGT